MNEKSINDLVGGVDLDESLLVSVAGGQCYTDATTCPPPPSTFSGPLCGTTIAWSCVPPGTFCP